MLPRTLAPFHLRRAAGLGVLLAAFCWPALPVGAATADIANTPLGARTTTAKPNIMFILDDSGSMAYEFMPDDINDPKFYGYYAPQCNGLAFNPASDYPLPIKADGTTYPEVSFTAAPNDGYNAWSGTADLSDAYGVVGATGTGGNRRNVYGYRQYYLYTGAQTALNWTYTSAGSVDTTTTFYRECKSYQDVTTEPGYGKFTKTLIKDQSADIKLKYARWYSYYRTRLALMRTATGRAFASLDANYRVGFTVISDTGVSGSDFLDVGDFNSTQKTSFYNKLYTSYNGSWTPLRGALSKVGRYYANRISGQTDPMQYSCQRNFTLLSTDGYWNDQIETSSYGPYQLDGSTLVGEQDGNASGESRPMKDSASFTSTKVETSGTVVRTSADVPVTSTFGRSLVTAASNTTGCTGGSNATYSTQVVTQSCTVNWSRTTLTDTTTTTTTTTVTTDGVTGSPSSRTTSSSTQVSQTTRPSSCTTWATTGTSTQCRKSSYLFSNYGIGPGGSTTITGTPSDAFGTTSTSTVSTTAIPSSSTTNDVTVPGDSNSLADVAEYYWKTDLRTGSGWDNTLTATDQDSATHQHMATYTVGLGVRGSIAYDRNYLTQTSGDFVDLKSGLKKWPVPTGTVTSGAADATHIDDLWHAAVNGRGQYFSATDSNSLSEAISTMLSRVNAETATGAAAAASTLTPVTGDDWIFLPSYTTMSWHGDLRAFRFTFTSGGKAVVPSDTSDGTEIWSARKKLDARTTERTIHFKGSNGQLNAFTYANLTSAGLNGYFDNRCTTSGGSLSQCTDLTTAARAKVTGTNLVSFLQGDRTLEMSADAADNRVFRSRSSRLGDFVNSSPAYVGKPPFKYTDSGYSSFASANASRTKMIYAGTNDGMLHAFVVGTGQGDATGGVEQWAYIPRAMMPNLWHLASADYGDNHRYFIDATPVAADVYDSANARWRTILVGGYGAGGRGYYALDVTTPTAPELLWEIHASDTDFQDLGLSFGNPIITKDKSNTWVVAFSSGINNVSGVGDATSGDGVGRLYVVNALSGARISAISTGAGSTTTPANLSRIEGWVESETNNTALRFYGGDMLGNLWRFDHDDLILPAGKEAFKLGMAKLGTTAQPITTKPLLNVMTGNTPLIAFGTGRYLGTSDLRDTSTQTLYVVKDALDATTGLGNLQDSAAKLVQQTLNSARTIDTLQAISWNDKNGWFINLNADAGSGERVNIDPVSLSSGELVFATTKLSSDPCTPGGTSYVYELALTTGKVDVVSAFNKQVVGMSALMNSDGSEGPLLTKADQKLDFCTQHPDLCVTPSATGSGSMRRATWRELIN